MCECGRVWENEETMSGCARGRVNEREREREREKSYNESVRK